MLFHALSIQSFTKENKRLLILINKNLASLWIVQFAEIYQGAEDIFFDYISIPTPNPILLLKVWLVP